MERLTMVGAGGGISEKTGVTRKMLCSRLAAYEDTELEPEDLKKAFNEEAVLKLAAQALGTTPERLRELVKARDEKRVLPDGSGWFVTSNGKKLTVIMDIDAVRETEAALGGGGDG